MKLIICIVLLLPLHLSAQYNFYFEEDSLPQTINRLEPSNLDSIEFEMRFWTSSELGSTCIKIQANTKGIWNHTSVYWYWKSGLSYFETPKINLEHLWIELDSLGIRELKDQSEATISYKRANMVYTLSEDQKERVIGGNGLFHQIELYTKEKCRVYSYMNALGIFKILTRPDSQWVAPEHMQFAQIVKLIGDTFQMDGRIKKEYIKQWKEDNKR